jgi:hypothetical protein
MNPVPVMTKSVFPAAVPESGTTETTVGALAARALEGARPGKVRAIVATTNSAMVLRALTDTMIGINLPK